MDTPINRRDVRRFIVTINYYREIWDRMSHMLQALTKLTPVCVKFKWTSI